MIRTTTTIAALGAVLALAGCEEEPADAVLLNDPVLEEQREETTAPLTAEDLGTEEEIGAAELEPVAGETEPAGTPETVQPAVAVMAIDVECDETPVFFETDAAALGPEDERKLDRLAACIQGTTEQQQIEITGRADPRASEPYNEALSRARAQAVADYLQAQGIAEDRFEIRAMGEQGVIEGIPMLWPAQRHAMVEPTEPEGS